jgi:hypothetical protein
MFPEADRRPTDRVRPTRDQGVGRKRVTSLLVRLLEGLSSAAGEFAVRASGILTITNRNDKRGKGNK